MRYILLITILLHSLLFASSFIEVSQIKEEIELMDSNNNAYFDFDKNKQIINTGYHTLNNGDKEIYNKYIVIENTSAYKIYTEIIDYWDLPFLNIKEIDYNKNTTINSIQLENPTNLIIILDCSLENNKRFILAKTESSLFYFIYNKNNEIEFYYPTYIQRDKKINFIYDDKINELFFSNKDAKYYIYQKNNILNVKVQTKKKTTILKGKNKSKYDLKIFKTINLDNLHNYQRIQDKKEKKFYTSLSYAIKHPNDIYRLNLSHQRIYTISKEIFKMKNIKWLYFNDTKITSVPKEICDMKNLLLLDLRNNNIKSYPTCLDKIKKVKK